MSRDPEGPGAGTPVEGLRFCLGFRTPAEARRRGRRSLRLPDADGSSRSTHDALPPDPPLGLPLGLPLGPPLGPSAWASARRFSMRGLRNLSVRYLAVTTVSPPATSIALIVSIAYMIISGEAGAATLTMAIAVPAMPSWFPLETSAHVIRPVHATVSAKIRAKHQGSHFRATLSGDSNFERSPANGGDAQNHTAVLGTNSSPTPNEPGFRLPPE